MVVARARAAGRLRGRRTLAVDATALDARYASTYYRYRYSARYRAAYATLHGGQAPAADHWRPRHPKLSVAADVGTHLILAAVPAWGPENDLQSVAPVLTQATGLAAGHHLVVGAVVADAGYDAERMHVLCRETLGIPATAIRLNPKLCGRRGPRGPYRRRMYTHFPRALYRRRPQVESVFSRLKRRLGAALTARRAATQAEELVLRVLTHNLLLLLPAPAPPFNRADDTVPRRSREPTPAPFRSAACPPRRRWRSRSRARGRGLPAWRS